MYVELRPVHIFSGLILIVFCGELFHWDSEMWDGDSDGKAEQG